MRVCYELQPSAGPKVRRLFHLLGRELKSPRFRSWPKTLSAFSGPFEKQASGIEGRMLARCRNGEWSIRASFISQNAIIDITSLDGRIHFYKWRVDAQLYDDWAAAHPEEFQILRDLIEN